MKSTREDAKAQGYGIFIYDSGDWGYKDENGHYHLIRDGEELTKGVKAKWGYIYDSGDWEYKDTDGYIHLFRDGEELTKNVKAKQVHNPDLNGDWHYVDTEGKLHLIERNQ